MIASRILSISVSLFGLLQGFQSLAPEDPTNPVRVTLKTETAFETNIFENYQNPTDAWNTQHWLRLQWQQSGPRDFIRIHSLSGCNCYPAQFTENKLSQSLALLQRHHFNRKFSGQLKADFFYKSWIHDNVHRYFTLKTAYNFALPIRNWEISWGPTLYLNRYHFENQFHSNQYGLQLWGHKGFGPHWVLMTELGYTSIDYPYRTVFQVEQYAQNPTLQKDQLVQGKIGIEFHDQCIFGLSLHLLHLHSNSSYAGYFGYSLNCYGTQRFGKTVVQLIAQLYFKHYSQELLSHLIAYFPDPEQNIQNQLLIGWERPMCRERLSLTGKAAYMRNESRYSGIYYEKWLITLGLQYRLR